MNQKTLEKIEAAALFLLWFRDTLSPPIQQLVRPYVAQPYQSALKVLDYFSDRQPTSVDAEFSNLI